MADVKKAEDAQEYAIPFSAILLVYARFSSVWETWDEPQFSSIQGMTSTVRSRELDMISISVV
eukprot:scaffold11328_cov66-Cyclotella_meneghiniana.AAC.5